MYTPSLVHTHIHKPSPHTLPIGHNYAPVNILPYILLTNLISVWVRPDHKYIMSHLPSQSGLSTEVIMLSVSSMLSLRYLEEMS